MLTLLFFDIRNQDGNRLLHYTCTLNHLRQEHFAGAKQVTNDVHAIHERAFNHFDWSTACTHDFSAQFFSIFFNKSSDAVNQGVG
jgi:hypothetical protein